MTDNQSIGRYEVERRIGRGLQGTVFLARDPVLDRNVAIKLLHGEQPEDAVSEEVVSPLEARISSRLKHPNIVSIYDIGMHNGIPYLVFEYVQGQTLRQMLGSQGSLSLEKVCSLAKPILAALAHAHSQKIVHLDLSPRNVLIDDEGQPRVMDFGLSQFAHNIETDTDVVKGSLLYMAPEHFSSSELGTFTDVYALGAMFYQLVTGVTTVDGDTVKEVVKKIVHGEVDMSLLPDSPHKAAFADFLSGSQQKDVRMRFGDAGVMAKAFDAFLEKHRIETRAKGESVRSHSTVQFLLRRMQRKEDFPSLSKVLIDINRLTNESGSASAEKLANVILRDYALTNKLLKLVNSAFYSRGKGEITSISRAIVVLGFDRVRSTANSLAYFSKLQGESATSQLKDSMIVSFLCGLIARHLAQRAKMPDAEEAFICGLFRNLGENLAIYYFPEDHTEIRELVDAQLEDASAAATRVLGVSFAEIGAEVAGIWHLPEAIVSAMLPAPAQGEDDPHAPMRERAAFAQDLCALVSIRSTDGQDVAYERLLARYGESLELDTSYIYKLLRAGLDKLYHDARILDFDTNSSAFCVYAHDWLARVDPVELEPEEAASS